MKAKRPVGIPTIWRLEPLEPRVLLSVVTPQLEAESNGGLANNDLNSAEALAFSYLLPEISPVDGFGPQQAAVTGTADGSGSGGDYQLTRTVFGVIGYYPPYYNYPRSFSLSFADAIPPGGDGVLQVTGYADLGGETKYLSLEAEGVQLGDLFVHDGLTRVPVTTALTLSKDLLAALAADGVITLTFTPSPDVLYLGTGYVTMNLSYSGAGGAGTGDYYSFDLASGDLASLTLSGAAGSQLDLQLYNAAGELLAEGDAGAGNFDAVIADFASNQAGTFYVCVSGEGEYTLAVNRNATLDQEDNGAPASAQGIFTPVVNGRRWVIGQVGGGDSDFYAITVRPSSVLMLQAFAPNGQEGANTLTPVLRLYDGDGNLLAETDGPRLRYRTPRGGTSVYYVEVAASGLTSGDYVLGVKNSLLADPLNKPAKPNKTDKPSPPGNAKGLHK